MSNQFIDNGPNLNPSLDPEEVRSIIQQFVEAFDDQNEPDAFEPRSLDYVSSASVEDILDSTWGDLDHDSPDDELDDDEALDDENDHLDLLDLETTTDVEDILDAHALAQLGKEGQAALFKSMKETQAAIGRFGFFTTENGTHVSIGFDTNNEGLCDPTGQTILKVTIHEAGLNHTFEWAFASSGPLATLPPVIQSAYSYPHSFPADEDKRPLQNIEPIKLLNHAYTTLTERLAARENLIDRVTEEVSRLQPEPSSCGRVMIGPDGEVIIVHNIGDEFVLIAQQIEIADGNVISHSEGVRITKQRAIGMLTEDFIGDEIIEESWFSWRKMLHDNLPVAQKVIDACMAIEKIQPMSDEEANEQKESLLRATAEGDSTAYLQFGLLLLRISQSGTPDPKQFGSQRLTNGHFDHDVFVRLDATTPTSEQEQGFNVYLALDPNKKSLLSFDTVQRSVISDPDSPSGFSSVSDTITYEMRRDGSLRKIVTSRLIHLPNSYLDPEGKITIFGPGGPELWENILQGDKAVKGSIAQQRELGLDQTSSDDHEALQQLFSRAIDIALQNRNQKS